MTKLQKQELAQLILKEADAQGVTVTLERYGPTFHGRLDPLTLIKIVHCKPELEEILKGRE